MEPSKSTQPGRRVFLFPLPYQGHINPMFQIAALLHRRGFSITIFHTQLNYPDTTRHPDFNFIPIPDGFAENPPPSDNFLGRVTALNTNCVVPFKEKAARLVSEGTGEPVGAVIVDAMMFAVRAAAEEMGLRTMILRTGSAASCNMFFAFPLLWEKGYLPIRDSELDTSVTELPPLRVRDLPHLGASSSLGGLSELLNEVSEGIRASSALILNTFDALERTEVEKIHQQASIPVFPLGPLHKFSPHDTSSLLLQDNSCIQWLDQQAPRSVIYVSFGSMGSINADDLVEAAWGLSESRQSFLWVIRPGSVGGSELSELPQGFEEETQGRGKVIEWAPQQEVLAHPAIGGFWTHNGWNSTMESISEGVPMLCKPNFGDQMMNARYVCAVWKTGIMLENGFEREEICKAIRRLMVDEGEELRTRAEDLKQKASNCIQRGGSSSMALGVNASVTNWDTERISCSLVSEDNPLVNFVELPDTCQGLYYCNILSRVIRRALEMVSMKTEVTRVRDMLHGDDVCELRVKLLKQVPEEYPYKDDE